jgi:phage shock protein E
MSTEEITEARKWIAKGAVVVDVRTDYEYAEGHLQQAVHIPVQDLETRLAELDSFKNKEIVVYCKSGQRSEYAKALLLHLGFKHVLNGGGLSDLT